MERRRYKAKHILLEDEEDALEVLELLQDGREFSELAREFSSCESSEKSGELGYFYSGQMDPAFERAVYNLKVGELSKPIQTKFGFHIILRQE